jgi:hypothetical protein
MKAVEDTMKSVVGKEVIYHHIWPVGSFPPGNPSGKRMQIQFGLKLLF